MTKLSQRMFTILISNGRTSCCNETISLDNPRLSLNFQLETWNMSIRLKGATMVEMDYRKEKKKSKFCPQCIVNKCMRQHAHGLLGIPPSLNYGIPIIGTFPIINFMISQLSNHVTSTSSLFLRLALPKFHILMPPWHYPNIKNRR